MKKNDRLFEDALMCAEKAGKHSHITKEKYLTETADLFSKWKKYAAGGAGPLKNEAPVFITDGVMDPEVWFKSDDRPLFVLKEAYGFSEDCDLANDHVLTSGKIRKTWKRISLWAKGMLVSPKQFDPCDPELESFGNKYLHRIAAINVKKYNGSNFSDNGKIIEYAKNEKSFLKRQIELCDPTVIVCCYTARALNSVIDFGLEKQYNHGRFYNTEINGHDALIIDYYHPSNQYPEILNYYALMEIYKRAQWDQYNRLMPKKE